MLGGFRYKLNDPSTSVALTAAGLATMQAAGVYDPRIEEGYDYVWRQLVARADEPEGQPERLPLLRALLPQPGAVEPPRVAPLPPLGRLPRSMERSPAGPERPLGGRAPRGRRRVTGSGRYGAAYATACNVLFLVVPDDALPMFHR